MEKKLRSGLDGNGGLGRLRGMGTEVGRRRPTSRQARTRACDVAGLCCTKTQRHWFWSLVDQRERKAGIWCRGRWLGNPKRCRRPSGSRGATMAKGSPPAASSELRVEQDMSTAGDSRRQQRADQVIVTLDPGRVDSVEPWSLEPGARTRVPARLASCASSPNLLVGDPCRAPCRFGVAWR